MLGFYDSGRGIDGVLEHFDFDTIPPWQLERIILGPGPSGPRPADDVDLRMYVKQLLSSDDFRRGVLRNFLGAFPEKRRMLFVHIPKCAGSDLRNALAERYFSVNGTMDHPLWLTVEERFAYLRDLVLAAPFVDTFFVHGHVPLRYYVNQHLIRPGDQIFTVIRDPVDAVLSAVNYCLGRLQGDPTGRIPDSRMWLAALGLKQFPADPDPDELMGFAKRILRTPRLVRGNILCVALGLGDAKSALANIVTSDIEITDLTRYETWLRERWDLPASKHANTSRKVMSAKTLDAEDRAFIETLIAEDQTLFAAVTECLNASGRSSITGRALGTV
jgi:hypothetical protein